MYNRLYTVVIANDRTVSFVGLNFENGVYLLLSTHLLKSHLTVEENIILPNILTLGRVDAEKGVFVS